MKVVKKVINFKKKVFAVRMNLDQDSDDVWNIYNLIALNDYITGTCHRKVKKEGAGLTKIENKTFTCTLQIKSFQYDTENDSLRINGINATENRHLAINQQQAMDISPPRQIMIVKKVFDSMHVRRLNQMIQEQETGSVVAVTMEEGMAHVFAITQAKTLLKAKIDKSITKSRGAMAAKKNATSKSKFYDQIINALIKNFGVADGSTLVNSRIGCVVFGSPGFTRDNFYNYLVEYADKKQSPFLQDIVAKTIRCHCSTGFKHSLKEMLSNTAVNQKIVDMSCAQETVILDRFFETLAVCEDKVTYGPKSVEIALREMAVETLLISDKLFRAKDIEKRKFYVRMHDQAIRDGLKVMVFSSMSAAGTRLNNLTGVAAILRYEMTALQDMVDEDEGDLDSDDDEGEVGATIADNSDAGSTQGAATKGSAAKPQSAAADSQVEDSSQFVSSVIPSNQCKGWDDDEEEKKSENGGGWDQSYLEDVFGAVEDIDYDDEVALEHLGEQEYRRQMSEQEEIKRHSSRML